MALTDIKELPSRRLLARMRIKRWLAGEHAVTRRMAGTAFAIRVASAVIVFLSQVLLARWMGDSEFGIYVYVWTWLMLVGSISACRSRRRSSFRNTPTPARSICFAVISPAAAGSPSASARWQRWLER